jgi:hypothetical protein
MNSNGQLEQRIDDLVKGVLFAAREVALAAVAEAFARDDGQLVESGRRDTQIPKGSRSGRSERARRSGKKRSPDELATLGNKLCKAISRKPGESMTFYAREVESTPVELGVPVRRLIEEGRVHAIGERNQRRYYAGIRE